jgi:hypothetical protein
LQFTDGSLAQLPYQKVSECVSKTGIKYDDIQAMNESVKLLSGSSGLSIIYHFMMSSWNGKTGIEKLILKFKNRTDFNNVNISIQHPGRMFAPEIIDSTFTIAR